MAFGCSLFGILANRIGLKWVLIMGTLGYAPYSASLYVNNRYGVEWFVLFGGATCGIAASALWASEGAIALGYGDVKDRGKFSEFSPLCHYLYASLGNNLDARGWLLTGAAPAGIWLGLRELGQLIGSSIQLSLNASSQNRGKVGYSTYLVLIALQCLGLPLALLVSPPHKVIKNDGSRLELASKNKSIKQEFRNIWALFKRREMFLMVPILIGFAWNGTYLGIYLPLRPQLFSPSPDTRLLDLGHCCNLCQHILGLVLRPDSLQAPQAGQDLLGLLRRRHAGRIWLASRKREALRRLQPPRHPGLGQSGIRARLCFDGGPKVCVGFTGSV